MAADGDGSTGLHPDIAKALDDVLAVGDDDGDLLPRLRRLIENCLQDNYDQTDVRAVIDLAVQPVEEEEDGA